MIIQDQVINIQARIDNVKFTGENTSDILFDIHTIESETDDEEVLGQLAQMESEICDINIRLKHGTL